eukprot:IDg3266t1
MRHTTTSTTPIAVAAQEHNNRSRAADQITSNSREAHLHSSKRVTAKRVNLSKSRFCSAQRYDTSTVKLCNRGAQLRCAMNANDGKEQPKKSNISLQRAQNA